MFACPFKSVDKVDYRGATALKNVSYINGFTLHCQTGNSVFYWTIWFKSSKKERQNTANILQYLVYPWKTRILDLSFEVMEDYIDLNNHKTLMEQHKKYIHNRRNIIMEGKIRFAEEKILGDLWKYIFFIFLVKWRSTKSLPSS